MTDHLDSWGNRVTGIGGPNDKSSGFAFYPSLIGYDPTALERLYEEDHISGRIVDALPDAVFVRGWTLELSDQAQRETIVDRLDALDAEGAVHQAMSYERLHGGSAIFLGADDARFEEPLREGARLLYLHVFDRWELTPYRYYQDPKSPKFGRPSHYRVHPSDVGIGQQVGVVVHESRLILFPGERTTKRKRIESQGWGQSALVRAYTAVRQYGGAMASVLALMADASQGVYKIKGLLDIIRSGGEEALTKRMRAMERIRSSLNAILIDADGEDYARVATVLSELGNLIDRFQIQVASAAKMPATEIFGRSAAGLNATGENDLRSWYDQIAQAQRQRAKPALERILRLIMRSPRDVMGGEEPESWSVKFPPVWLPTATETATIRKIKMETAILAKDAGVLNSAQIARGLFSGSEWDGEIVLSPEEISLLDLSQLTTALGGPGDLGDDAGDGEASEPVLNQDDETELGEELSALNARELAAQMTEHALTHCEHGRANRCPMCGIERLREVSLDGDGNPVFTVKWHAIGERAPAPVTEPDAEEQA